MPELETRPVSLSLPVVVADPLETNRALLTLWIQAAAEELGIRCDIQAFAGLPASYENAAYGGTAVIGEAGVTGGIGSPCGIGRPGGPCGWGGVIMLSPLLAASWNPGAGMPDHVLWVHGEIPHEIAAGIAGDVSNRLSGARSILWPVKQGGMRRILAEAAILYGAAGAAGPDAPFGQPVPLLLQSLVPRLVESVRELWVQCGQYLDTGDHAEAIRAAHSLKGAALSFGQRLLAECAGCLMDALEKGNAQETERCRSLMDRVVQMSAEIGGEG